MGKSWTKCVEVEGKQIAFKIDTGAEVNILPLQVYNKLKLNNSINKTSIVLEVFGGNQLKPSGLVSLRCGNTKQEFVIVDCKTTPTLGLKTSVHLGIVKRVDNVVCKSYAGKDNFIAVNKDVFSGIGKFKDKCMTELRRDACSVIKPTRRVPLSIKNKLKQKLEILEKEGIIVKATSPIEWASNLVIVEKPDGSLRLCIDPKELNNYIKKGVYVNPNSG